MPAERNAKPCARVLSAESLNRESCVKLRTVTICAVLALAASNLLQAQEPPKGVTDQLALLKSSDPKLAAN